ASSIFAFFLYRSRDPQDLHPFPTRRSSDLTVWNPSTRSTNGYATRAATSAAHPSGRRALTVTGSHLFGRALAHEAVGTEDEDENEDREDDRVGPAGGNVLVAPRRQEADEEAAERRARHVADAAEHGRGECPETGLVAHPPLAD